MGASFNNIGVPGAKSFHVVTPGYGSLNPYFGRMASSGTTTMLADAVAQNPTFFTLSEMGGNDVLGYATSGGTGVDQTGNLNPATYGLNDITDPTVFSNAVSQMVTALTANGAKGVITNVPYITDLAHFTTVPHNPVPLDATTAGLVNSNYTAYNNGVAGALAFLVSNGTISQAVADAELAKRTIEFTASTTNAVVILDENLIDLTGINPNLISIRQATAEDLIVLPAASFIGTLANPANPLSVNGVAVPLADKWVLTPQEQNNIRVATDAYNAALEAIVAGNDNVVLADLNSILTQASTSGFTFDNFLLNTNLVTGGLISLDGIHLTARGYALMANEILKAMDTKFGTNFGASGVQAKANDYRVVYPVSLPNPNA